jgi:hypothetical protein
LPKRDASTAKSSFLDEIRHQYSKSLNGAIGKLNLKRRDSAAKQA